MAFTLALNTYSLNTKFKFKSSFHRAVDIFILLTSLTEQSKVFPTFSNYSFSVLEKIDDFVKFAPPATGGGEDGMEREAQWRLCSWED